MTPKIYSTVREARGALALEYGFDVFVEQKQRVTKAALASYGYVVDRAQVEERRRRNIHVCSVCQNPVEPIWNGSGWQYLDTCPTHTKWHRVCDNGHRWSNTDADDKAADHRCPKCEEYWV
jgi:hypothetical protein